MSTTRAVTALAALIHDSRMRRQTDYGVALDVDRAGMLMSPEAAVEMDRLRIERDRYRTAWRMAYQRAQARGWAADRSGERARQVQTAMQDLLASLLEMQIERDAASARVAELGSLMGADPVALTEAQVEALATAGNRALCDAVHEEQCACDGWPEKCPHYAAGAWDMGGLETALPAVLGLWEVLRNDRHAAKVGELRAMVAELEAQRDDLLAETATADAPRHARLVDAADTLRAVRAECPSCASPADSTGCRIPQHRDGCPRAEGSAP